jgi:hypothetical protein
MCDSGVVRGSVLAVGLVEGTARYPRTAKFLQFGGRFDSERVALARTHILLYIGGSVVRFVLAAWRRRWRLRQVAVCDRAGCLACVAGFVQLLPVAVTGKASWLMDFA